MDILPVPSTAERVTSMYKEGYSDAEVAAALNVTIKDYHKQINDSPAFAKLVDMGRTLSQAFWESQFRKNLATKGFNTALLTFFMKNKYNWADKTESTTTNETTNFDLDQTRANLSREIAKFMKKNSPELTDSALLFATVMPHEEA